MPFVGIGLHFAIALFFAVHAVRTGQQTYWLFILFSFPLLGSMVYALTIYLPNSRLERQARKAVAGAVKRLDPTRELRAAHDAYDQAATVQNRMRLAAALFEAGEVADAADHCEACLHGPFANEPELRYVAARANLGAGRPAAALRHVEQLRQQEPGFRPEAVALLLAQALAADNRHDEARSAYIEALRRFDSFDCRAEYAIWAAERGDRETALRLRDEIARATRRWNRHTRELNAPTLRRLEGAWATLQQRQAA